MEEKKRVVLIYFILSAIIFLIQTISAFGVVSDNYSVNSYHTGIAGQEPINSQYNSRFTSTYQQGSDEYAENSQYTANIGWFESLIEEAVVDYCGNGTCDAGETCSNCPADCGVCEGDGGGGCTYDWVCSEWYPEPCPQIRIQNRLCVNRGTCSGTTGMPEQTKNCTPTILYPADPLFDIFARIPLRYKWINPGDIVAIDIKLINLGNTTILDVFFKYWIVDKNNKLIAEMRETRAISEKDSFRIAMVIPPETEVGDYKFHVQITYDEDKSAVAEDSFGVIKSKLGKFIWIGVLWLIILLIIIILIWLALKLKKYRESQIAHSP